MSRYSKTDYENAAKILLKNGNYETIIGFSNLFKEDCDKFDRERFLKSCGVE